jgi:hypothetical protein
VSRCHEMSKMEWATAMVALLDPLLLASLEYWAERYVPLVRHAPLAASTSARCSHVEPFRVPTG